MGGRCFWITSVMDGRSECIKNTISIRVLFQDCKGMNESEMEDELIEVDHEPQDLRMNTTVTQQQQEKGGDLSDKSKQEVTVSFRNQNANVEK